MKVFICEIFGETIYSDSETCVWRSHGGAHPNGHKHGGRKPNQKNFTEFGNENVNWSLQELINIKKQYLFEYNDCSASKIPQPNSSQLCQRPRKTEKMKVKICRLNILFLPAMILDKSKSSGGSLSLAEASALYRYREVFAEEGAGRSIIP